MSEVMSFSFRDLYPGGEGLTTAEKGVPEIEDKLALGIRVLQDYEQEKRVVNGRRWITLFVLLAILVMFRYI